MTYRLCQATSVTLSVEIERAQIKVWQFFELEFFLKSLYSSLLTVSLQLDNWVFNKFAMFDLRYFSLKLKEALDRQGSPAGDITAHVSSISHIYKLRSYVTTDLRLIPRVHAFIAGDRKPFA